MFHIRLYTCLFLKKLIIVFLYHVLQDESDNMNTYLETQFQDKLHEMAQSTDNREKIKKVLETAGKRTVVVNHEKTTKTILLDWDADMTEILNPDAYDLRLEFRPDDGNRRTICFKTTGGTVFIPENAISLYDARHPQREFKSFNVPILSCESFKFKYDSAAFYWDSRITMWIEMEQGFIG